MQLHDLTALVARLAPRKGARARRLPNEVFAVPAEQQAALDAISVFGINTWALVAARPGREEAAPAEGAGGERGAERLENADEYGDLEKHADGEHEHEHVPEPEAPEDQAEAEAEEWHDSLSALDPTPSARPPPSSAAAPPRSLPHATPHGRVSAATSSPPTPLIIRDRAPRPRLAVFRGETPRHDEPVPDEDEDEQQHGETDDDELSEYERARRAEEAEDIAEKPAPASAPAPAPSTSKHNTQDSSLPRSQDSGGYGLARYSTAPPLPASAMQPATSSASAPASAPARTVLVPTTDESDPRPAASTASSPAQPPKPAPATAPTTSVPAPKPAPAPAPAVAKRAREPTPDDQDADDEDEQPRAARSKRPRLPSAAPVPGPSAQAARIPKLGGWKPDLCVPGLSASVVQRMAAEAAAERAKVRK